MHVDPFLGIDPFPEKGEKGEHGEHQEALHQAVILQGIQVGLECRGKVQENAHYHEQQKELVRRLLELGLPAILVTQGIPYDLLSFPSVSTNLVSYSNRDVALEVLARVLLGDLEPEGRLPVSLPGLYEAGWRVER